MSHLKDQISFGKKTRLLARLKIGGSVYDLIMCSALHLGVTSCSGVCDTGQKVIYIDAEAEDYTETLIHEMCHALFFEFCISRHSSWCEAFEEVICEAVGRAIGQNFQLAPKPGLRRQARHR